MGKAGFYTLIFMPSLLYSYNQKGNNAFVSHIRSVIIGLCFNVSFFFCLEDLFLNSIKCYRREASSVYVKFI